MFQVDGNDMSTDLDDSFISDIAPSDVTSCPSDTPVLLDGRRGANAQMLQHLQVQRYVTGQNTNLSSANGETNNNCGVRSDGGDNDKSDTTARFFIGDDEQTVNHDAVLHGKVDQILAGIDLIMTELHVKNSSYTPYTLELTTKCPIDVGAKVDKNAVRRVVHNLVRRGLVRSCQRRSRIMERRWRTICRKLFEHESFSFGLDLMIAQLSNELPYTTTKRLMAMRYANTPMVDTG